MKIVTAGSAFIDIDAFAGCIAYAELLRLLGEDAQASSSAPLNKSVTPSLRSLGKTFKAYQPGSGDEFVILDISSEEFFDPIVSNGKIVEIIDHHPGYEDKWHERLGEKAQIELVGAVCTQILERWQEAGLQEQMDAGTARLLAAGILDNTLDFKASITTDRDHKAYAELTKLGSLTEDYSAQYFSECQSTIEAELEQAIKNDTKLNVADNLPKVFGQLTVWDGKEILSRDMDIIESTLRTMGTDWVLNLISISDGKSFFVTTSPSSQQKFSEVFGVEFKEGVAMSDRLWLRKEILKAAIDKKY